MGALQFVLKEGAIFLALMFSVELIRKMGECNYYRPAKFHFFFMSPCFLDLAHID